MSDRAAKRFVITVLLVVGMSVLAGCYQESPKVVVELPNSRWERIFFKVINQTTNIGGLTELRKLSLNKDEIEVRVWRGFGLANLEGVMLKRTSLQWKAFHVKADNHAEPKLVEVTEIFPRKSDFDPLWTNVTALGLLTIRDPSESNCEESEFFDGSGYVVEIHHDRMYRTYMMVEGGKCEGVSQMEAIDDLIGEEFDSGEEQCKAAEWFPCAKLRKSYRQSREQ